MIRFIDYFYPLCSRFIPNETFRYAATGGANTALDILLYFVFYRFILDKQIVDFGFVAISPHIAAFVFVFPITFTTGFLLAKYITFTSSSLKGNIQLFRYGVTVFGAILMNYALLKLFVDGFGLYATLSKILTTIVVVTYSYFVQRFYSFKTGKSKRVVSA
ncbi:MAG: phenylalanine 4-monooxygenase [Bacteroidetes bacterium HGW-Bacteroidetes-17]|nr:MAG: phenylalanine 4-monooxygenase [Bacteroidetes bacterium HGW-Bacteroidetes-17]